VSLPDGPSRHSQRRPTIEKNRFLGPDVAVVQVSSEQVAVSFTNVAPNRRPDKH
jgi:hypothetical protein